MPGMATNPSTASMTTPMPPTMSTHQAQQSHQGAPPPSAGGRTDMSTRGAATATNDGDSSMEVDKRDAQQDAAAAQAHTDAEAHEIRRLAAEHEGEDLETLARFIRPQESGNDGERLKNLFAHQWLALECGMLPMRSQSWTNGVGQTSGGLTSS